MISWVCIPGYHIQYIVTLRQSVIFEFLHWPDLTSPLKLASIVCNSNQFTSVSAFTHTLSGITLVSWHPASLPHSVLWGSVTLSDLVTIKAQSLSWNPLWVQIDPHLTLLTLGVQIPFTSFEPDPPNLSHSHEETFHFLQVKQPEFLSSVVILWHLFL